jgi:iron complex outermembrane recepter protein
LDCSGERAPYSPEWTLNLSAEQGFVLDGGAQLLAMARAHYQSSTLTGLDFTPLEYQDAYWSLDLSLSLTTGDGRYRLGVFGTNLTDETVVANTFQPPLGSFVVGTLRPPRLYGLRLGIRF